MIGIFWAAVAGIGFGLFQTLNRQAGRSMDAYRATFILILVSAAMLTVASLATEDLSLLGAAPISALIYFGLSGFIHFFISWTFISMSQKRIGAARTGAVLGTTPLFAAVIAALLLGEILNLPTILGIVLVVTGVYLVVNR